MSDARLLMAQSAEVKILYITHRFPYPLNKGERIRCAQMLRILSRVALIDLISFADEPVHPHGEEFVMRYANRVKVITIGGLVKYLRMCAGLIMGRSLTECVFDARCAKHLIRDWVSRDRYDYVVISNTGLYPLVSKLVNGTKLIVDMMDVDSRKWAAYARDSRYLRPIYHREAQLIRCLECAIAHHADTVLLTTPKELSFMPPTGTKCLCMAVGNGVDCDFFSPATVPSSYRNRLAFMGALDYWPNIEGLSWFLSNVWPVVRERIAQPAFYMVGRKPSYQVRRLANLPGVTLYNDVTDVRPIILQCGIAVFPLRLVFGIPNKVLEAMALGRACIVSEEIANVIGGTPGIHYLIARNSSDWVSHICALQSQPHLVHELGWRGRQLVMEKYAWDKQLAPLIKLITPVETRIPEVCEVSD